MLKLTLQSDLRRKTQPPLPIVTRPLCVDPAHFSHSSPPLSRDHVGIKSHSCLLCPSAPTHVSIHAL
jgi:hypothetical protein